MISEEAQPKRGKFGRAALTIASIASGTSLVAIVTGVSLLLAGHQDKSLNYFIGVLVLLCGFFQLLAIPIGVIGLFESSSSKRPAWIAIILSSVIFAITFSLIIAGMHRVSGN
jgi:hypothetical protein